jgi:hypothetical protein
VELTTIKINSMTILNGSDDTTSQNNEQDVVITDDELALVDDDTAKKVQSLSAQKAHFRDKAKKAEDKLKEAEAKLASLQPVTQPINTPPQAQASVGVEEAAMRALISLKAQEELGFISEDKRATVKEFYGSLTAGKNLQASDVNTYMEAAKRAAGVTSSGRTHHSFTSNASGSVPPTTLPGPTPEEAEMARRAGNDPNKVYGKDANYSGLHNAEKFIGRKEQEFN